jgi:NAD(P)-dependent dehydrogenase (short-subunit alcohol dehydrogenase family)
VLRSLNGRNQQCSEEENEMTTTDADTRQQLKTKRRRRTVARVMAGAAVGCLVGRSLLRRARAISFSGKSVLIVGGSRGLGLVMARELAAEGARVTLAARDSDELDRARTDLERLGRSVIAIKCDVRDPKQIEQMIARVVNERGSIDVLVNDAGIIQVGPLEHMTVADFEEAMATHFWGPLHTILAALPHMRQNGDRRIVNISSIGGKIPAPHLLPYTASKFALTGLSEGLRVELAREGFFVTTVCPGLMRTGSSYNAWFKGQHRREFAWFHIADSLPGLSIAAQRAAHQIIEACRHGDPELIITLPARLAVLAHAITPATTLQVLSMVNRLLPGAADGDGDRRRSGWQSVSRIAPSAVTTLTDRASRENNEVPVGEPST